MSHAVTYRPSAVRNIGRLPSALQNRLIERIQALADDARGPGTKPLSGSLRGLNSPRVGDWRVAYTIDDTARVVEVLRVGHRRDFYRQLGR